MSGLGVKVKAASELLLPETVDGYLDKLGHTRDELRDVIARYGIVWDSEIEKVQLEILLVIGMVIGTTDADKRWKDSLAKGHE